MSEDGPYRRTPSPQLVAIRSERLLLTSVRRGIGEMQKRAAFVEARARSTRSFSAEEAAAEVGNIRQAITAAREQIAEVMQDAIGVGPAQDCRKALAHIEQRLANL